MMKEVFKAIRVDLGARADVPTYGQMTTSIAIERGSMHSVLSDPQGCSRAVRVRVLEIMMPVVAKSVDR